METKNQNSSDILKNAFLQSTFESVGEDRIATKAEDVQNNSGIDFSKHFFEAKPGNSYIIKFLPNPGGEPITHRSVYKNLPDPQRKGKTFHYVSSGNAKTCKALELFFELHALKKEGDAIAEKKIEKYLSRTNQGCVKIQVLQSPVREEIGIVRMMSFATFGPNATIANLIDGKLNPSKEKIAAGEEREDIFNIFDAPVMSLECTEAVYDGVKGRDFTKSSWLKKNRGAIATLADGTTREFKKTDLVDGKLIPEAVAAFESFVAQVCHEDYDVRKYFAYKEIDDARNDKDTNDYLKAVQAKVDEIIPVIKDKSLTEIAAYGKAEASSNTGNSGEKKEDKAKNVMAESLPEELAGSVMNAAAPETKSAAPETKSAAPETKSEADDILNS